MPSPKNSPFAVVILGCLLAVSLRALAAAAPVELWNGRDFAGWSFHAEPGAKLDPASLWSVRAGAIHCTGVEKGYIRTAQEFADFHLRVESRWPEQAGNSGVFVRVGAADQFWPRSFECQLKAGSAGDIICMGGARTAEQPAPTQRRVPRRGEMAELPPGGWNVYDIFCWKNTITVYVNGTLQNRITDCSELRGAIALQSEGAPVEFRNVTVRPLAEPVAAVLPVAVTAQPGGAEVTLAGERFTAWLSAGQPRPLLYPLIGPGGVRMGRDFPLKTDTPDEPTDHPHHRSLWFAHGLVNGHDFWTEKRGAGRIETVAVERAEGGPAQGTLRTRNRWLTAAGAETCADVRVLRFRGAADWRAVDYFIELQASAGPVVLGDTKEGTLAFRSHPHLQLAPEAKSGPREVYGHARNSEGIEGKAVWGKRARWVAFWGTVEGKSVGFAVLDHVANLRHPTPWMARDYGLVAANPFGLHELAGAPKGSGNWTIPAGGALALGYRFLFFQGAPDFDAIDAQWCAFSSESVTAALARPQ
ncbi:MAG: PmoA family protein [Opitutae bacterium]|nr:PmoA family protein [Opitutae bacterium]